jgi:hypothetical protein
LECFFEKTPISPLGVKKLPNVLYWIEIKTICRPFKLLYNA